MAELTKLESKLGEVAGLAMAAQAATEKVTKLAKDEGDQQLVSLLEQMHAQARETEQRCTELAGTLDGKKTAILEEARATKQKGAEMMSVYLDADAETLDGVEFLVMAEAGEVGHWEVLEQLSSRADESSIRELVAWALPIQRNHLASVRSAAQELAADEDPMEQA
jgi:hypothetical protein